MTPPNRFRFRFWDQDACKFTSDDTCATLGLCVLPSGNVGYLLNNKLMVSDIFQAQQSTGLLDRNRKEIFEGDIVSDDRGLIGYIKWEEFDLSIGLVVECKKLVPWYMHDANKWEIIGNIYEHPELLK